MRSVVQLDASQVRQTVCPWCGKQPRRAAGGFEVRRDGKLLGVIGFAPSNDEAGHTPAGSAMITVLWVHPYELGEHVGTQLLQRLAWHLRASGYRYLVSSGSGRNPTCDRPPAEWLQGRGFTEHVAGLQWRLDLRRTAPAWRWLADAAAAAKSHLYQWRPRPENATRSSG
jgi:hypothetical protein